MKIWLTIIAFACSHVTTAAAWTPCSGAADARPSCRCCEPGNCSCPCMPPPTDDPQPRPSKHAALCSCDDQPVPLPESQRPVIQRLSELHLTGSLCDAFSLDQGDRPADAYPQAHCPPPHLTFVKTFVLLS